MLLTFILKQFLQNLLKFTFQEGSY